MTKLSRKTNLVMIMVISLLLVGSSRSITKNIELSEKDIDDLQEQNLEALQDSGNNHEEIRVKVEGITSYEEHDPISINSNTNFNDTAYAEGWLGNGTVDNPYVIEGLNITGPSGSDLIHIENTDVYFQINNSLIVGGSKGIYLYNVVNGLIANNTVIFNNYGIYLDYSENNVLFNNTASYNVRYGIYLLISPNNVLINNTVFDNVEFGILIYLSGNNRIVNNSFTNNGLSLRGSQVSDYLQLEVANNTVNGKILIFWQNINGGTVPDGAGQVILVNSISVTVTGQNLSHTDMGLLAAYSSNLIISNNTVFDNLYGICFDNSVNSDLSNNTVTYNSNGIRFDDYSANNNLHGNIVSYNSYGIFLLDSSTNNNLYGNIISHNSINGISLSFTTNNALFGNIFYNNSEYGITLFVSENNLITWNDFTNNNPSSSSQGNDASNIGLINTFDYNYWNNWTTPDLNSDGIVDSPYTIDGDSNNQDSHPLTTPLHLSTSTVIFPNGGATLNGIITIQWSPTIDQWGHSVAYTLYYSDDSGSTWFSLASDLDTTSYQWDTTTVLGGSEYLLKVVTICSAGLNTEDVTDSTFTIQNAVVTLPSPPQSLTATAGESFVYLNWTAPSSDGGSAITGYWVYRGTSSGAYTLIFIASDTHHNDTLISGDTTYHYVVTAINAVGESAVSNEVSATPTEPISTQPVAPDVPQSLTATAGELSVYLSWSAPSNDGGSPIIGYRVYRGISSGTYALIFIALDTNYNDTLVNGGVTYYYVVTAINAVGESTFSNEVSATPTTPATTTTTEVGTFPGVLLILVVFITLVVFTRRRNET